MTPPKSVKKRGRPESPTSARAWRTRKEAALAQLRELQLERERGGSLSIETAARRWEAVGREVQARILSVTSRVRAQLPQLTAADADVLDRELRAALTALADAAP